MDRGTVIKLVISAVAIAMATFSATYAAHPDAKAMAYIAAICGALGSYGLGLYQDSPFAKTNGLKNINPKVVALALLLPAALGGCASSALLQTPVAKDITLRDLTAARNNLQAAVTAGVLPADDPALTCLNGVVPQVTPTSPLPVYTNAGLVSFGSLLYIDANKLGAVATVAQQACDAIIGRFLVNGVRTATPFRLPGL